MGILEYANEAEADSFGMSEQGRMGFTGLKFFSNK